MKWVKVEDLKEGDKVDLETCPFLKDHPMACCEYAEVIEVQQETTDCVAVTYEGVGQVGYSLGTKLGMKPEKA